MKSNGTVLIIDDEKKLNDLLARILRLENYEVLQSYTAKEGLLILKKEGIDVVLSDVRLPDANGIELLTRIKEVSPFSEVINLTAFGAIKDGVQAVKNGAFDYLTKGDDNERILPLLEKAMEKVKLSKRGHNFGDKRKKHDGLNDIIGESIAIRSSISLARKVASQDTTILLQGETGTGKEVFARAIHAESRRSSGPFLAINCSAFGSELLESELFGYKQGAFTGALKDKKGLFEEADGGTIFLDEIGEMSLPIQARLLRVLEDQSFIKLGDTRTSRVNVRIIAATNRRLEDESGSGNFRADLFYRLSVFTISLPSLRERPDDIKILADHYLREYAAKFDKPELSMSPEFLNALKKHTWRGNVRELKNVMERVVILTEGGQPGIELLPFSLREESSNSTFELQDIERQHISRVLAHTGGNKTEAARLLGIGLTTLYRKIAEYDL